MIAGIVIYLHVFKTDMIGIDEYRIGTESPSLETVFQYLVSLKAVTYRSVCDPYIRLIDHDLFFDLLARKIDQDFFFVVLRDAGKDIL